MSLWRMVLQENAVLETMEVNGFGILAIETSDCHWKLEGEIRSFSLLKGPFEIIEGNLISQMLEERS